MTFLELVLFESVAELGGRVYATKGASMTTTNCSRFVGGLLTRLHGNPVQDRATWQALMISDPSQPFSPIDECVRQRWGEATTQPIPGRVHLVQGWRHLDVRGWVPNPSPVPNGHSFLFYEPPIPMRGTGLLINANTSRPWARRLTWGEAVAPYRAGVELCALVEP